MSEIIISKKKVLPTLADINEALRVDMQLQEQKTAALIEENKKLAAEVKRLRDLHTKDTKRNHARYKATLADMKRREREREVNRINVNRAVLLMEIGALATAVLTIGLFYVA